jgi:type I site-specific restriction endonuclease
LPVVPQISLFQIYKKFRETNEKSSFFISENTNRAFCKTFLENALLEPSSGEIGKTIVFCVSQNHAANITQYLKEYADKLFPINTILFCRAGNEQNRQRAANEG